MRIFYLLLLSLFLLRTEGLSQTRLSYADTTGAATDFQSALVFNGSYLIWGYGERFNLPISSSKVESVDFVLDSVGSDSLSVFLIEDSIFTTGVGPVHLPNVFTAVPYASISFSSKNITAGSRTYVNLNNITVPDSFFVLILGHLGSMDNFRAFESPNESLILDRAVFISGNPQTGLVSDYLVDPNFVIADDSNIDMDIGITYENAAGVRTHISPASSDLVAFPNPTKFGNPVRLSGSFSVISAEVLDATGWTVRDYHSNGDGYLTEIPTAGLSSGVYEAILLSDDGNSSNVKFVVQ